MKIKLLVGIMVVGLVLGGCGSKGTSENGKVEDKQTGGNIQKSLRELIAGGQAQKCIVEINNGEETMKTEMWIKGKKLKQIVTTKGVTGNIISDGEWMYSWGNDGNQGIKIKVEESPTGTQTENKSGAANIDWDKKVAYDCKAVNIDDSEFAPPAGIEFIDMQKTIEEQMKKFGGQIPTGE